MNALRILRKNKEDKRYFNKFYYFLLYLILFYYLLNIKYYIL